MVVFLIWQEIQLLVTRENPFHFPTHHFLVWFLCFPFLIIILAGFIQN